jgi:hypothetical protein
MKMRLPTNHYPFHSEICNSGLVLIKIMTAFGGKKKEAVLFIYFSFVSMKQDKF